MKSINTDINSQNNTKLRSSLYNTYLPLGEDLALIYNALSDKYVAMRSNLKKDILHNLTEVEDSTLRSQLIEIGALVTPEVDEIEKVRNLIAENDHNDEVFILHVNPTVDCNFRCWYCYEDHRAGSRMSADTLVALQNLIEQTIASRPKLKIFDLSFFGGEPLMGFHNVVKPLVQTLEKATAGTDIETSVHFTTNAYLINEEMVEFFARHKAGFQITLDGHRDFHDKVRCTRTGAGSYDRILKNIQSLAEVGSRILVRINFTRENMASIPDIIADFNKFPDELKKHIRFDLQRVWQDMPGKHIEDDISTSVVGYQQAIRDAGFGASLYRAHDSVRNSCYGDKRNYVLVNYDGGVFLCTARDFDDSHRAGTLMADGNIKWINNAHECRLAKKFSKPVCHTCRIAPICGGGCCTQALEHPEPDKCIYNYTETQKDDIIATRFEQIYMDSSQI